MAQPKKISGDDDFHLCLEGENDCCQVLPKGYILGLVYLLLVNFFLVEWKCQVMFFRIMFSCTLH